MRARLALMGPLIGPVIGVLGGTLGVFAAPPVAAREVVEASEPQALAVSIYRDPERGPDEDWNRDFPRGFAMISEDRSVTLPAGESTIRFTGVSEGMVAVTAIVTGLPGGTIEKNRNADLLSPAALVDGTLGNRVTITRTNPGTGASASEQAIVRTRADGGLVLQTADGFEAVRCSGLPEKLTFGSVPAGLSAKPVFSIDTGSAAGGTYKVRLTYLSWGFDWQANYVATLPDPGSARGKTSLTAWLTLLNDNGQSFENAELMAVAGRVNQVSDFRAMADPPRARPLRLTCWPLGSTADGSPVPSYDSYPPPPPPSPLAAPPRGRDTIVVTGSRMSRDSFESAAPVAVVAGEEQLGDLKLYRFPEPVTVAAKGQKQVAFLQRDALEGEYLYRFGCDPYDDNSGRDPDFKPAGLVYRVENKESEGLGRSIPQGSVALFEPSDFGPLLVGKDTLRDYAVGQEIEIELAESAQVFAACGHAGKGDPDENGKRYTAMIAHVTNANPAPVRVRMDLGWAPDWSVRGLRGVRTYRGRKVWEGEVRANSQRTLRFRMRRTDYDE